MEYLASNGLLHELDGLNPARALILQAYYALRRVYAPTQIGVPQIAAWIKLHEPEQASPSEALIQLTLQNAKVVHRRRGRPRGDCPPPVPTLPLLLLRRRRLHGRAQR